MLSLILAILLSALPYKQAANDVERLCIGGSYFLINWHTSPLTVCEYSAHGRPGHRHTEETKLRLSLNHMGQKPSEETLLKRSKKLKGRVFSEEHKAKIGKANSAEANGNSKLDWDKVRAIRIRLINGDSQKTIANDYGVDPALISKIKQGHIWREDESLSGTCAAYHK